MKKNKQPFKGFAVESFLRRKIRLTIRKRRHYMLLDHPAVTLQFDKRTINSASDFAPVRKTGRHALQFVRLGWRIAKDLLSPKPEVLEARKATIRKHLVANRKPRRRDPGYVSSRGKKLALMEAARSFGWRGRSYQKALRFDLRLRHHLVEYSGPRRGQRRAS